MHWLHIAWAACGTPLPLCVAVRRQEPFKALLGRNAVRHAHLPWECIGATGVWRTKVHACPTMAGQEIFHGGDIAKPVPWKAKQTEKMPTCNQPHFANL